MNGYDVLAYAALLIIISSIIYYKQSKEPRRYAVASWYAFDDLNDIHAPAKLYSAEFDNLPEAERFAISQANRHTADLRCYVEDWTGLDGIPHVLICVDCSRRFPYWEYMNVRQDRIEYFQAKNVY